MGQSSAAASTDAPTSSSSVPPVCTSGVNGHGVPPTTSPNYSVRPQLPMPGMYTSPNYSVRSQLPMPGMYTSPNYSVRPRLPMPGMYTLLPHLFYLAICQLVISSSA